MYMYTCTRTKYKQIWEVILIVRCLFHIYTFFMLRTHTYKLYIYVHVFSQNIYQIIILL